MYENRKAIIGFICIVFFFTTGSTMVRGTPSPSYHSEIELQGIFQDTVVYKLTEQFNPGSHFKRFTVRNLVRARLDSPVIRSGTYTVIKRVQDPAGAEWKAFKKTRTKPELTHLEDTYHYRERNKNTLNLFVRYNQKLEKWVIGKNDTRLLSRNKIYRRWFNQQKQASSFTPSNDWGELSFEPGKLTLLSIFTGPRYHLLLFQYNNGASYDSMSSEFIVPIKKPPPNAFLSKNVLRKIRPLKARKKIKYFFSKNMYDTAITYIRLLGQHKFQTPVHLDGTTWKFTKPLIILAYSKLGQWERIQSFLRKHPMKNWRHPASKQLIKASARAVESYRANQSSTPQRTRSKYSLWWELERLLYFADLPLNELRSRMQSTITKYDENSFETSPQRDRVEWYRLKQRQLNRQNKGRFQHEIYSDTPQWTENQPTRFKKLSKIFYQRDSFYTTDDMILLGMGMDFLLTEDTTPAYPIFYQLTNDQTENERSHVPGRGRIFLVVALFTA
ncbi:MAG: hypothetical protein ABEJ65_03835 [bacterium]